LSPSQATIDIWPELWPVEVEAATTDADLRAMMRTKLVFSGRVGDPHPPKAPKKFFEG
jgi:hypothetical protein